MYVLYFIILLCLTPDNFISQGGALPLAGVINNIPPSLAFLEMAID
jgi:hypothetical protein